MGDLVSNLLEIFQGTVISEDDVRHIVAEQWPKSSEVGHAMTYLRRHFPRGMIPKQVTELPGAPFDPITLRRAALAINCWRREDANIVAFPRTKRYDGRSG